MTVYLAAPPGDSLRSAREHFHNYVKPILVAAAMDWDVIEGRKEGDVRWKIAEKMRKKRKRAGEGEPMSEEEAENSLAVESIREKNGTLEYPGLAGDIVLGRNTWKEYVRGLHEGWLGPVDPPKQPGADQTPDSENSAHTPGHSSLGDAAVKAAVNSVTPASSHPPSNSEGGMSDDPDKDASPKTDSPPSEESKDDEKEEEEEKPKPRHPPPYIQPSEYTSATPSARTPEIIGPSAGVRMPHILGFRNTPIRIYRFLTRRHLADSVGRDVAAAILESHRPYSTSSSSDYDNSSGELEQVHVLQREERDWWKTTFQPRKEHEESVWIEDMALDERIAARMRAFQLTVEDEDRAKRIQDGKEKAVTKDEPES